MRTGILLLYTFLMTNVAVGYAQNDPLKWINKNAHPLTTDTSLTDLAFLSAALKNNVVLGLGEASHGTKEFYHQKKRIIQYLITNLKYRNLGFEFSDKHIKSINQYVLNGSGDLKELMSNMALYNTPEIYDIFRFIKLYNDKQSLSDKVTLFGFDSEDFWADPLNRDKYMADLILENKKTGDTRTIIWSHNVHVAKDTTMAGMKGMGAYLKDNLGGKYYAVGFDTFSGTVSVLDAGKFIKHDFRADPHSYSQLFAASKYKNFFISFDKRQNQLFGKNNITNIYSNRTPVRALPIRPGFDFDAVIFLRNTNASAKLD